MSRFPADEQRSLIDAAAAAAESAPCDDARAVLEFESESVSRFALNRLHQGVEREVAGITVQAAVGRRIGTVTADAVDPARLPALFAEAIEIARALPEAAEFEGFYRPPASAPFDDTPAATEAWNAPERAAQLAPAFARAAATGFGFAGSLARRTAAVTVAVRGAAPRLGRRTSAEARLFAADGPVSGFAGRVRGDASTLDLPALAELALERAARGRAPRRVPPGKYPVILMPHAAAELIEWFCSIAATAASVEDGMSVIAARKGERISGPRFSLRDDAGDPAGLPFPFDYDGRDRAPLALVERGVAGGTVNDTLSAARLKQAPTGHALQPGGGSNAAPLHVFFDAGESTEAEMIAAVERGIYVSKLHYVNGYLDPHRAVMTGLTRDGAFLIEDGKLAGGIENLRFTQGLLEAGERIRKVSALRETASAWWSALGSFTVPALLIDDFHFTGYASDAAI